MIHPKWSQRMIKVILVLMMLPGCASPLTPKPTATQSAIESVTPSPTEVVIVDPTSTPSVISNFEECVASGHLIENTIPRQCTIITGETFKEALSKGVIFSKVYDVDGERDYSLISTIDGGYLITGSVDDFRCLIRKVDRSGEKEWEQILGPELREEFQFTNGLFVCRSAWQIADGTYVVFGTGWHEMGLKNNYFFLRLDRDGTRKAAEEFRWRNDMSLQLDEQGKLFWLHLFGMLGYPVNTLDKGYAVIGRIGGYDSDDSMHIVRADANGNYMWDRNLCNDKNIVEEWERKAFCSNENLSVWDAIQMQDGGFVFTGGYGPVWLVKTNSNGFIEWIKSYDAVGSHAIIQTSDKGFLIAGNKQSDGLLIKTDQVGNIQWMKTFGGNRDDTFDKMIMNPLGQIIIMGSTDSLTVSTQKTWLLGIEFSEFE